MNLYTVLFPYAVLAVFIYLLKHIMRFSKYLSSVLYQVFFLKIQRGAEYLRAGQIENHSHPDWKPVMKFIIFGLFISISAFLFFQAAIWFSKAPVSENCKAELDSANVVLAFGFGIEKDSAGNLYAGQANDAIMLWIKSNTHAKYIIAQKGCAISKYIDSHSRLIEMHPHKDNSYINTFKSADYALCKLDSLCKKDELKNNKVIVVAHHMQLSRAVWILKNVSQKRSDGIQYQFISPNIPEIPFPSNSIQTHTKNKLIYTIVELYISRPRDYINSKL